MAKGKAKGGAGEGNSGLLGATLTRDILQAIGTTPLSRYLATGEYLLPCGVKIVLPDDTSARIADGECELEIPATVPLRVALVEADEYGFDVLGAKVRLTSRELYGFE